MKALKATRLAAADITEFEAIHLDNDDEGKGKGEDEDEDEDEDEGEGEQAEEEVVIVITDDTDEATIIDLLYKLKILAKVLLSLLM
jgi:hypothetical protein